MDWKCPYSSQRSPVFARNLVATSQPLAVEAGIHALRSGGNAVDAALASAITLTVVEPSNNGIGSDAFAIIWDGKALSGLNASGRSPAAMTPEHFAGRDTMPTLGWDAVTVPGAVSAWVELSSRYGKLPFERLFDDAIEHARAGYQVGPKTAYYWGLSEDRFAGYEDFKATFLPEGKAPGPGDVFHLPDHAESLVQIAVTKGESFYRGDLASAMVADCAKHGGLFTLDDFAGHRCDWAGTLRTQLAGHELHEIPPNGQGLMALIGVGILERLGIDHYPLDSADSVHLQIEATRTAYAQVERHLADETAMKYPAHTFLSDEFLAERAAEVSLNQANPTPTALGTGDDTVYLTTADASGMMVSFIQSNYRGFGSGVVVPGTGISLQNRGSGFVLEPGHPNQVGPAKRPYHTIIPGFVMRGGQPAMSFGVMGGHMQAQGHLQMMLRIMVHGQNPQAASDAPRWYLFEDGEVALENGFDGEVAESLRDRGHEVVMDRPEHLFGGGQFIYRMADGYCGASDHRKEGLVAGF